MILKTLKVILLGSLIAFIAIGCSQRKNPIGINDRDKKPTVIEVDAGPYIEYYYSFQDSIKSSAPNTKLLVGHYDGNSSVTLLQFSNLPDSGFVITEDAELSIGIKGEFESSGMKLSIAEINQIWVQHEATWSNSVKGGNWEHNWNNISDYAIIEEIHYASEDSVVFVIPKEKMQLLVDNWTKSEPEGYGLAIFATDTSVDAYIELFNKDSASGPQLRFKYQEPEIRSDEVEIYEMFPLLNTFINSVSLSENSPYSERIVLANLPAERSVIKFDEVALRELIMNKEGVGAEEAAKYFFNRVDLILYADEKSHISPSEGRAAVRAFHLKTEYTKDAIFPVLRTDMEVLTPNYPSIFVAGADSLRVNITSQIQSYITGTRINNGTVFVSTVEMINNLYAFADNRDNTRLFFHGKDAVDSGKRPRLRLVYTKTPF